MDADSSYGGSDTAQDLHSNHDNSSLNDTTTSAHNHPHNDITITSINQATNTTTNPSEPETNNFYHKNEITLPINYDEADYQNSNLNNLNNKEPHYLTTAKLNVNENEKNSSNLEELSKNFKSTSHLNTSDQKDTNDVGLDNPAFNHYEDDEYKNTKLKSTFDNNRPYNGDLNTTAALGLSSPNKNDEPLTEAVNLELINLKPGNGKDVTGPYENGTNGMTTGIPLKKENDAEVTNPYDEYFVPVNEHRKYISKTRKGRNSVTFAEMIATSGIDNSTGLSLTPPEQGVMEYPEWLTTLESKRGEKLYVTMDKRNKKKNRCLCWSICLGIVAAAVIIGILAAVGVIGNQGPKEVTARHFPDSSDSDVNAAGGIFGLPLGTEDEATSKPTPGLPVSTIASVPPSTDTSKLQVPHTLESELVIDNLEFSPELQDKNSPEYKKLAQDLETEIKKSLFSNDTLNYGPADIAVKIVGFSSGSVQVKYRIAWVFKEGIHNAPDPINDSMLQKKMRNVLSKNDNYMGRFHIKSDQLYGSPALDSCQIDNHNCQYNCSFNYNTAEFQCSCPDGMYLEEDGKNCGEHSTPIESEIPDFQFEPSAKPEPSAEPEPTVAPQPEPEPHPEPEPTAEPQPEPEPTAEPQPEPEPTSTPESTIHKEMKSEYSETPKSESENKTELTSEESLRIIPLNETSTEPTAEPNAEPTPEPNAEPAPEPNAEPTAEPNAEPTAEPTAEPNAVQTVEHNTNTFAQLNVEPTPEPNAEPTAEPTSEPNAEPAAEPTPEPNAEPLPEPNAEPTAEPNAEPTPEPNAEPTPEPNAEPTAEPTPGPNAESVTNSSSNESTVEHIQIIPNSHNTTTESEPISHIQIVTESNTENKTQQHTHEAIHEMTTLTEGIIVEEKNEQSHHQPRLNDFGEEITTTPSTTTTNHNLIINSQEELIYNSTESNNEVHFMVNDTPRMLPPSNNTEPKIYEITSPPSEIEIDHDDNNVTHANILIADVTETTNAFDNMSPFLPEIDNDTFVTKLHLGEPHHEDLTEVPPPRLDNDEKNTTNPHDLNPIDVLKIVPIEEENNNKTAEETTEITAAEETGGNETHQNLSDIHSNNSIEINLFENETTTEIAEQNTTEEMMNKNESSTITTTTTTTTEKVTLPPEIINNIHSNPFFDNLDELKEYENHNSSESTSSTTAKYLDSSTEDLLALETTTNNQQQQTPETLTSTSTLPTISSPSSNDTQSNESSSEIINPTTISDVELSGFTSTEMLSSQDIMNITSTEIPTILNSTEENIVASTEITNFTSTSPPIVSFVEVSPTSTATPIVSSEAPISTTNSELLNPTTMISGESSSHQYQVNEYAPDITTTEKLFLPRASTEMSSTTQDLSIVPLESNDDGNNLNEIDITTTEGTTSDKKKYLEKEKEFDKKAQLEKLTTITEVETTTAVNNEMKSSTEIAANTEKLEVPETTTVQFESTEKLLKDVIIPLTKVPKCTTEQFQCVNGTARDGSYCIDLKNKCDAAEDCSDGSDEIGCDKEGCNDNFQCKSGQCLKRHLVCDGIQNCNDGSDESDCDKWTCITGEYACGIGHRCLPANWECDGRKQCADGVDELRCTKPTCSDDMFRCEKQGICIPKSWRCDGNIDCEESEDENLCECADDEFKCQLGGGCVKSDLRCNGVDDCADRSDEWNCLQLENISDEDNNTKIIEVQISKSVWSPICFDHWNQAAADLICREFGNAGASTFKELPVPESKGFKEFFKLRGELTDNSILSQLEKTDNCENIVSMTCQEFVCGSHSTVEEQRARIVGGNQATEGQWPSLTLLQNKKTNLQCTATLLTPLWVIASHSCISQSNSTTDDWVLYAGNTNFFSGSEKSSMQEADVKRIISHPLVKYSRFEYENDLTLVELVTPLNLTRNVSAVCLPEKEIESRQLCLTAGWGISQPGETSKNQYLHYLPVPVIEESQCNSKEHYNGLVTKDKICAGYTESDKGPCYNDEGAPLMCFSDSGSIWELQGVLSHQDNCNMSKHPAVYTSISSSLKDWVLNTIGQKSTKMS